MAAMSKEWLVAMGIEVRCPQGHQERSILGHRLLLVLRQGPRSGRELHALLGHKVHAAERRAALAELQSTGLVTSHVSPSGSRGGRPRETWTLCYPGSSAVQLAEHAVRAAAAGRQRRHQERPWVPSTLGDLRRVGLMPPEGGRRRSRRLKPVPADVADKVCDWIASGRFLRDYCRRPGAPAARTVYAWAAKDPEFARRFRLARDFGEEWIRDSYMELIDSPIAMAAFAGGRQARRDFHRGYVRPIDLRLQRWRKHPRRPVRLVVRP